MPYGDVWYQTKWWYDVQCCILAFIWSYLMLKFIFWFEEWYNSRDEDKTEQNLGGETKNDKTPNI